MNQLTESELQTLEQMEPHEFHRVLMQMVAGGMTAWRDNSARPRRSSKSQSRETPIALAAPVAAENADLLEAVG